MEKFDVYDRNGNKTGVVLDSNDKLTNGQYRMATNVWIFYNGKVLVQKRSENLRTAPGKWAPTSGSSVMGETPLETVTRECFEELGIKIPSEEFFLLDKAFMGKFFMNVFVVRKKVDIKDLVLQKEEVADAAWLSIDEIIKLMADNKFFPDVVLWTRVKEFLEKINKV